MSAQRGVTLVELLVSLVVASLIVLTVLALYATSAGAFRSTDGNQQLQDNARFLTEVLSQAVRQAGLQDAAQYAWFDAQNQPVLAPSHVWDTAVFGAQPALAGANNAKVTSTTNVDDFGVHDNGGHNRSDVFAVRYFGSSRTTDASTADGSVIDCRGMPEAYPLNVGAIGLSLFMVAGDGSGEPALVCINRARAQIWPLVSGVESFQVMYAVDADPALDETPNRWLNAQQVGDAAMWPRVRAVRFGFVLRGPVGSGVQLPAAVPLFPFGDEFSNVGGAPSAEPGMRFMPPNDGRLRRAFSFTVATRNVVAQ